MTPAAPTPAFVPALALALFTLSGCGAESGGSVPGGSCTPGVTQACYCTATDMGVQICAADGARWEACDCSGNPVVPGGTGTGPGGTGPGGTDTGGTGPGTGTDTDALSEPAGMVDVTPASCASAQDAGAITFEKIAVWQDDAEAAYSMIHDDLCGGSLRGIDLLAVPAMNMRGLTAALGPYVDACQDNNLWDVVASAQRDGHEIGNHSYSHPEISTENAQREVVEAKSMMDQNLDEPVSFYIFPYDYFTPQTIAAVQSAGHIGARAGNRDDNNGDDNPPINPATPGNDLEVEFDVWPRQYSKYALYAPEDMLRLHVWNAIESGGWAVREFHSVSSDTDPPSDGSQGFGPVPIGIYETHLDFLVQAWKAGKVWTANPSEVIRYRRARTSCTASVAGGAITFGTSAADCTTFHTPISVVVTTANDVSGIQATQGGSPVSVRKLGPSRFSVTADPTLGDVQLSGCATPVPVVDPSITLQGRPSPAASVCDLETVVGTGSDGRMDDLERPTEQFQLLPNPSQADGRTGSWSNYPQTVTVEQFSEGDNTVLRYAGTGINKWTGVTLAFLGGNGAGSCYDASAYSGLRFRIKGQVTGGDLAGKVILSMVTAETQRRSLGGDLEGADPDGSGHFNKVLDVSASWQTVELRWADLNTPAWGPTSSLTSLALGKLQALDWGISKTATSFEVFFDDIELF